jgi:hypothetical protein
MGVCSLNSFESSGLAVKYGLGEDDFLAMVDSNLNYKHKETSFDLRYIERIYYVHMSIPEVNIF